MTHTKFFEDQVSIFSLDIRNSEVRQWCTDYINTNTDFSETASLDTVPAYASQLNAEQAASINVIDQCMVEQKYVRGAMARAALYLQVSISGQALVFVVRTLRHSFNARAGALTYVAFAVAQGLATIIAVFGFNGYDHPANSLNNCQFCSLSTEDSVPFFASKEVPLYGTESVFTASVIGCTGYVIAAWIWSIIWHFGLDPIKWMMLYILDEEGFRQKPLFQSMYGRRFEHMGAGLNLGINKPSISRTSVSRVSMGGRVAGGKLSNFLIFFAQLGTVLVA